METLKCLSIRQPYVEQILTGRKKYEVRSWRTNHTGLLLIHAAKKPDNFAILSSDCPRSESYPLGAICGIVEIGKAVISKRAMSCYYNNEWHWPILRYHKFATPIRYCGQQRLFNVPLSAIADEWNKIADQWGIDA